MNRTEKLVNILSSDCSICVYSKNGFCFHTFRCKKVFMKSKYLPADDPELDDLLEPVFNIESWKRGLLLDPVWLFIVHINIYNDIIAAEHKDFCQYFSKEVKVIDKIKKQLLSTCSKCIWYNTAGVCLQLDRCKKVFMSKQLDGYKGDFNESNWTKGLEYSTVLKTWTHRTMYDGLIYANLEDFCEYYEEKYE